MRRRAYNQLTDVRNMWFKDGVLRTRPGLKIPHEDEKVAYAVLNEYTISGMYTSQSTGYTYLMTINENMPYVKVYVYDRGGFYVGEHRFEDTYATLCGLDCVIDGETYDAILYMSASQEKEIYGLYGTTYTKLKPYAPLVMLNGAGSAKSGSNVASGDACDGKNLLTGYYRAWFNTDAESKKYYLPEKIYAMGSSIGEVTIEFTNYADETDVDWVWTITAEQVASKSFVEASTGSTTIKAKAAKGAYYIEFDGPLPEIPEGAPSNNLKVTVCAAKGADKCMTMVTMREHAWFGGSKSGIYGGTRLFVAGSHLHKNTVFWSDLNNPLHFSENNSMKVGSADSAVTGFGKQSDMLVIFKERELYYTTYVAGSQPSVEDIENGATALVDVSTLTAVFPLTQLSGNIGCDLPRTIQLMQNRLVWADSSGRVWSLVYSSEYSQRNVRSVGGMIERKLKDSKLSGAASAVYGDYYLLICGNDAFALDTTEYGYSHYTSYYSDSKAQKKIAWYYFALPQIGNDVLNEFMVAARLGTDSILFSRGSDGPADYMLAAVFAEGEDETTDFAGNYTAAPISCMFQTKLFDMGSPEKVKTFDRLYIGFGRTENLAAGITYVTEKGSFEDSYIARAESIAALHTAQFVETQTLTPNMRCRRFAVRVENEGEMYVDGLGLSYKV